MNALQAFPFAAWDDISAAPLNPEKVVEARKLEISYAEKKPVWKKVARSSSPGGLILTKGMRITPTTAAKW